MIDETETETDRERKRERALVDVSAQRSMPIKAIQDEIECTK